MEPFSSLACLFDCIEKAVEEEEEEEEEEEDEIDYDELLLGDGDDDN